MYSVTRNDIVIFSEMVFFKKEEVVVFYCKARTRYLNRGDA